MKETISTSKAPGAVGPYVQAVKIGERLITSGQLPIDPATGKFPEGGAAEQARQSLLNLKAVIEEGGFTMADVVKTTVFIKDMDAFAEVNRVYAGFFSEPYPARSCVEVARLPKDALVEIEAICAK